MQIDLSIGIKTITGKSMKILSEDDNGHPIMDDNGNQKTVNLTMWSVIESQLNQYQGGDGTKIKSIGIAMVKAMEEKSEIIDIPTTVFTFLKDTLIKKAKITENTKNQINDHLESEDEKHKKVEEKKEESSENEEPVNENADVPAVE